MGQHYKAKSKWVMAMAVSAVSAIVFVLIFQTGCQSVPLDQFSKLKIGMSKDEALELVGSPHRTEMIEGKDKWAYRYYVGDDKETEILKQITFYNGHIINFGADEAENKRIDDIKNSDEKRARRYEAEKEVRKNHSSNSRQKTEPSNTRHYQEMTGKSGD